MVHDVKEQKAFALTNCILCDWNSRRDIKWFYNVNVTIWNLKELFASID